MGRIPTVELSRYLLEGRLPPTGCLFRFRRLPYQHHRQHPARAITSSLSPAAASHSPPPPAPPRISPRKQFKDESKRLGRDPRPPKSASQSVPGWDLFVGIEIHAQLNSPRKLFSPALAPCDPSPLFSSAAEFRHQQLPNSQTALFDLAVPGSQPIFQPAVVVPAVRAALALGCEVREVSRFDRKHYFWWDQPGGYQLTQYYEPFARDGAVILTARDGIAAEDRGGPEGEGDEEKGDEDEIKEPEEGEEIREPRAGRRGGRAAIRVGIRQVQLEQDTAKTVAQPGGVAWLDFNRSGVALIEIITDPVLRHPRTAAALVRKVQTILRSVDACVSGMEAGGLRADVNVSVRRTPSSPDDPGARTLGTRTEIKNLGTIKAVEDAVIAERDRQIAVLSAGGVVLGETRGWTLGARETHRLRGKEGEVDYRYMPDPDVPPLRIGGDLVSFLRETLPASPDLELDALVAVHGLSDKDAVALASLDEGNRVRYFYRVTTHAAAWLSGAGDGDGRAFSRLAANWVLHEFGRLTSERSRLHAGRGYDEAAPIMEFGVAGECERIPAAALATLLRHLFRRLITAAVAKSLLFEMYDGVLDPGRRGGEESGDVAEEGAGITRAIEDRKLWFDEISGQEYEQLLARVRETQAGVWAQLASEVEGGNHKKAEGKVMFLVGKMRALGPRGRVDPVSAREVVCAAAGLTCADGREGDE